MLRNLVLAALLYACIFGTICLAQTPSFLRSTSHKSSSEGEPTGTAGGLELLPEVIGNKSSTLKLKLAGTKKTVKINPHANVFNRPDSAVLPRDDYLGSRPHADMVADIKLLVEQCRGSYSEEEKVGYVHDCLQFLAQEEEQYYSLPPKAERASTQSPKGAELTDVDGHGNTRNRYLSIGSADAASNGSIGKCPGPIIPYHTYWTGLATWRVEIFIKSYLYTQNLACSRLHIWLDSDTNAKAVEGMLAEDPIFIQFLPLVGRGDIILENWKFPTRIPLPKGDNDRDDLIYYDTPGKPDSDGTFAVADGVIEDAQGQQWLKLSQKQMSFLPVAVSDAVRFIILHQYGGMYFDMDVLMLRDMRPLALAKEHNWAERWGALQGP